MTFEAVDIEYAFARLNGNEIGGRGTEYDADVFRGGKIKDVSVALIKAVEVIDSRVNALPFVPSDSEPGGIKARLSVANERLRRLATAMSAFQASEPNDYHWAIVGCLVSTIAALLETLERREA